MKYQYYIEFVHKNSEEENYDMQSKWFSRKQSAIKWLRENFDYISQDVAVFVMTAKFNEDSYDIIKSEKVQ